MKKIILLLSIVFLTVNAYALTEQEQSTARKLFDAGIFTEQRSALDWQEPIRTIDCASAVIKSLSAANDNIEARELFYSNKVIHQNKKIKDLQSRVWSLEEENDLLFATNDMILKEIDEQKSDRVIMWLTLVAMTAFNLML